ncbi:hypothetical protein GGH99_004679, partial [Coemansia sp. RSA 1285]
APHGAASDQHSTASGATNAPTNAAAALSYSALLNNSHQQQQHQQHQYRHHQQQQHHHQQQQRRRLSNAPSDGTEGRVHAGPAHLAGSDDQDDTSEDEIETLKRAMGSDQWALQRQRMRREQLSRPTPGSSNTPSSPLAPTDASSAFMGKTTAPPPAAASSIAAPVHTGAPHTHHHPQRLHYSSHAGYQHGYPLPPEVSPPVPQVADFSRHTRPQMDTSLPAQKGYTSSSYVSHPQQQQQQQQHLVPPHRAHQGPFANTSAAQSSAPYIYATATSAQPQHYGQYPLQQQHQHQHNHPHGSQPLQPAFGPQSMQPQAAPVATATSQQWPAASYPPVPPAVAEGSTPRYESISAWGNDQMSASLTDTSGVSQPHRLPGQAQFGAGAPFDQRSGSNASTIEHYLRFTQEQSSSYSSQSHFQQQQQQPQQRSPKLAHGHQHGYSATESPSMEQRQSADNVPAGHSSSGDGVSERSHRHPRQEMTQGATGTTMQYMGANKDGIVVGTDSPASAAAISSAFSTAAAAAVSIYDAHAGHVTGAGSIGTYRSEPGHHTAYPQHTQIADSSAAITHKLAQEMQEQRQSPSATANVPSMRNTTDGHTESQRVRHDLDAGVDRTALSNIETSAIEASASSAITIQSLLNSPLEDPASSVGTARGRRSVDAASEPSTISEHIAKENARFRQNSNASSHLPALLPRAQQPPTPTAARQDSGPNSQSSYHSAGYSLWNGYAETVNQDFATAQQSLSSMEGPRLGVNVPPVDSSSSIGPDRGTSASNSATNAAAAAAAATSNSGASRGAPLGSAPYLHHHPHPIPVPAIPASLVASMAAVGTIPALAPQTLAGATGNDTNSGFSDTKDDLEHHRPSESLPRGEREFGFEYYKNSERILRKPVSIMVQVGDDSQMGSDEESGSDRASASSFSQVNDGDDVNAAATEAPKQDANVLSTRSTGKHSMRLSEGSDAAGSVSSFADNPFGSSQIPGRKATMESLDNVLEYYRSHAGAESPLAEVVGPSSEETPSSGPPLVQPFPTLDSDPGRSMAPSMPSRNPFESLKDAQYRPQLGSSRTPVRDPQTSPLYQRTSFSSPTVEPHSRRKDPANLVSQPPLEHPGNDLPTTTAADRDTEASDDDSRRRNMLPDGRHDVVLDISPVAVEQEQEQKALEHTDIQPASRKEVDGSNTYVPKPLTEAPPDSSIHGSNVHSREPTPIEVQTSDSVSSVTPDEESSNFDTQANEHLFSTRRWQVDDPTADVASKDWLPSQPPPRYHDIYDHLEDPSDLEDLVLPPTSVTLNPTRRTPKGPRSMAGLEQKLFNAGKSVMESLDDSDEDCIVQMESIDGISELSDILDIATTQESDYGYTNSNNSTDSFGEPIEQESGILSKSLAVSNQGQIRQRSAARRALGEDMVDLGSGFARISLAPMTIHQLNSSAFAPPVPPESSQLFSQQQQQRLGNSRLASIHPRYSNFSGRDQDQAQREALHSGRTNTSTLTTSTALGDSPVPDTAAVAAVPAAAASVSAVAAAAVSVEANALAAVDGASIAGNQGDGVKERGALEVGSSGAPAPAGTTVAASGPAKQADNLVPLEIMEHASELEISLAREQEDYFSDNVSPANLDPIILQNLGKAVHHQCLLQRQQQLQRRKSNMHLGLGTAGGNADDHSHSAEATIVEPQYDDYEQALRAMLIEVSQYFTQSGLCFVFPFSAKWVEWLTRHPDRPFPWRKDAEDDDELAGGRGRRGRARDGDNDDDGEFGETQSDVSSFSEELLVLSRPLPPEDVLAKATIPMSMRRPVLVKDFVSQEKRKGINAHWQYYSVINQIVAVASGIHRRLLVPDAEADHSFVAHQLAALYQFLGGEFKKYKPHIESVFDLVKQSLDNYVSPGPEVRADDPTVAGDGVSGEAGASSAGTAADGNAEPSERKVLDKGCANVLREMMASIITDAL